MNSEPCHKQHRTKGRVLDRFNEPPDQTKEEEDGAHNLDAPWMKPDQQVEQHPKQGGHTQADKEGQRHEVTQEEHALAA
jgi:hypothetical protein